MRLLSTAMVVAGAAGGWLAALSAGGCDLFQHTSHFIIRVDSIVAPRNVARTDTLRVRFYGSVGPDGCWSLDSVERQTTSSTLDVTFRGAHDERSGIECTQMLVYLDHGEQVAPPLTGPFIITAHEPDGSRLTRTVTVQ